MTSNTTTAEIGASYQPFIESDPGESPARLRATMQEHGYLFFRGLVPVEEVMAVRREALELCREAGWLDESRDLMDAVVRPGIQPTTEGQPDYMVMYRRLLKTPRFHDFPAQPAFMDVAGRLLESDVFVHPRRIGRVTFPHYTVATTPPHQDHFYIRGSVDTYSCWVPLGACPIQLGGLAVWRGSHRAGFQEHTEFSPGAVGGRGVPVDEAHAEWHISDYEPGDTLFFHSFTVHKAMPNLTPDRLRISTDNRYQRPKDEIEPGALQPHYGLQ
ncbi:MAG: phytanoyl-CoA dioxygenase family protein [Armatimonadota bacterium]|nr:phytanoyl-CoA dioxygenase family protein [Armatimonadota bacterium]